MTTRHIVPAVLGVLLLLWALFPPPAEAAERRIGTITATAPTAQSNSTTGVPFTVPANAKLSIQCDADAYVVVGTSPVTATSGEVRIAAGSLFPTSTGSGGAGAISILPVTGTAICNVFVRSGNEV